ncbi:hypothetical protein [Paraburkholderia sp. JHI869]|uniref:hypothetical protein n=1 Tax=Paraburkholderia sp. JHI869 TaxID=3112959 RepID=UPI00316B51E1
MSELEGYARFLPDLAKSALPPQRERQRAMSTVALALRHATDSLAGLDEAARGWLLAHIYQELGGSKAESVNAARAQIAAQILQPDLIDLLNRAARAARDAADTLPEPAPRIRAELYGARAVLGLFAAHELPFSQGENGFAAEALRALLALCGLPDVDRVGYWLRQAIDNPANLP